MQVCLSGAFRYGQQLSAVERVFTAHNLLVAASENPLRATTINDCAKLGTALGGTPTIVGRLRRRTRGQGGAVGALGHDVAALVSWPQPTLAELRFYTGGTRRRAKKDRISSRAAMVGWPASSIRWAVMTLWGHTTWRAKNGATSVFAALSGSTRP